MGYLTLPKTFPHYRGTMNESFNHAITDLRISPAFVISSNSAKQYFNAVHNPLQNVTASNGLTWTSVDFQGDLSTPSVDNAPGQVQTHDAKTMRELWHNTSNDMKKTSRLVIAYDKTNSNYIVHLLIPGQGYYTTEFANVNQKGTPKPTQNTFYIPVAPFTEPNEAVEISGLLTIERFLNNKGVGFETMVESPRDSLLKRLETIPKRRKL